jgi:hypothetical protein
MERLERERGRKRRERYFVGHYSSAEFFSAFLETFLSELRTQTPHAD